MFVSRPLIIVIVASFTVEVVVSWRHGHLMVGRLPVPVHAPCLAPRQREDGKHNGTKEGAGVASRLQLCVQPENIAGLRRSEERAEA
ncbi:hypothetical protein EDB89DRAFT_2012964 [Lactarius sanguifluus]|nr:hypothetical protein EDB89DRAFT_2012964 [Lactarius sanguifluus]